ncbi:MAG: S41 family peptidase [Actinomycetota bacterium]
MVSRSPKKKATVRTSGKISAGKRPTTKRVKSELGSPIYKQEVDSGESEFKDKDQQNSQVAKKNDRVLLIFLGVFIAALFFLLGTGFGNSTGKSLVDGAIDELVSNSTVAVDREILERAAIEGALKASGDDWANYFPSSTLDELNNSTANVLTGIGISIREARSGAIEIASIQESTPAFKNGLKVGDQILEVNGTDVQGSSLTTVVALIRGDLGKEVVLRVNRDGAIQIFSLLTERIDVRTVDASQIAPEIAYLSVNSFSSGTSSEFYNALKSLKSSKGVVIDLRDNPGGLVEEAVSIAELFIGRGTVVSYRANGEERIFTANNPKPSVAPVVLMINKGTTSAAEILAGAFQDRNRGVVIGQTSFGKGSVQEFMTLKDGSKLELTVALYLTPSGRTIEGVGISPDLRVKDSEIKIKALQVLGGLSRLSTQN